VATERTLRALCERVNTRSSVDVSGPNRTGVARYALDDVVRVEQPVRRRLDATGTHRATSLTSLERLKRLTCGCLKCLAAFRCHGENHTRIGQGVNSARQSVSVCLPHARTGARWGHVLGLSQQRATRALRDSQERETERLTGSGAHD